MKNQNFINHIKDLVEKNIDNEIIQWLKYDLEDGTIKLTDKQREIIKQIVETLDTTKKDIMKKIRQDFGSETTKSEQLSDRVGCGLSSI